MKTIQLSQGHEAQVDDEDYEWLNQWKWSVLVHKTGHAYAVRGEGPRGKSKTICMHHMIVGKKDGHVVDHINRNPLDNRRSNLRHLTHRENVLNSGMWTTNSSGFRGVSWDKGRNKWQAKIKVNQKQLHLGRFNTAEEAAQAYDAAAREYFGEFAFQNIA